MQSKLFFNIFVLDPVKQEIAAKLRLIKRRKMAALRDDLKLDMLDPVAISASRFALASGVSGRAVVSIRTGPAPARVQLPNHYGQLHLLCVQSN